MYDEIGINTDDAMSTMKDTYEKTDGTQKYKENIVTPTSRDANLQDEDTDTLKNLLDVIEPEISSAHYPLNKTDIPITGTRCYPIAHQMSFR